MENDKRVEDLRPGDHIQGFYMVKDVKNKVSANNKPYMDMTLCDKTGEINGKLWEVTDELKAQVKDLSIVKVRAKVNEWLGKAQLRIDKIRVTDAEDAVKVEDFVPSAPFEPTMMYDEIMFYASSIVDTDIKMIVLAILDEYKEPLMYYPAAKSNHHAIRSGLLYHVLRMLRTAEKLSDVYSNVNRDLLYAGVILHDMEKINEMASSELGVVSEYTRDGQLLGHIIMGINHIEKVGRSLNADEEKIRLIQHLILTHHYEPEYGSPKKPMIPEAELLHYIDMIDARMYDMDKVYKTMDAEEFSEPVFVLDRRRLYKSSMHQSVKED